MSEHHLVRQLHHIARELDELAALIAIAVANKDWELAMAIDLTALPALGPRIDAVAAKIAAEPPVGGGGTSAADQAAVNAMAIDLGNRVAALEAAQAGDTDTPPAVVVTISPTAITTPVGTPLNGTLTATGGAAPYTFAVDPAAPAPPADVTVGSDGSVSVGAGAAETGSVSVIATDANGVKSASTAISITVA